jgi:hypothetical protein
MLSSMPDWHCSFRASRTTRRRDNDRLCKSVVCPKSASAKFAFTRTTHTSLNEKIADTASLCLHANSPVVQGMLTHKTTNPTSDNTSPAVIATHLVACVAVSVMGSLGLRSYLPLWDMATRLPWRSVCTRLSRSLVLPASTAPSPPG